MDAAASRRYLKFGYDPADKVGQSAAETVDAAYGDFCIAQVAKALGKNDDYAMFMKRSENWRNLFDPKIRLHPRQKFRWQLPRAVQPDPLG